MNKFVVMISSLALAGMAFAQDANTETPSEAAAGTEANVEQPDAQSAENPETVGNTGFNPDAPTDIRQAPGEGNNDLPKPKRPTYNFNSYGLGVTVWHNWEDSKKNPKRDWDQGFNLHHARIWEMGTYGAITLVNNSEISLGDHWQWGEVSRIGGRVYFADAVFAPFLGIGIGLGIQLDGHYDDFSDGFAVGLAFGGEVGLTIFRTSQTQLEIGCSYDNVLDYLDFDRRFGSFNFYIAINY